MKIDKTLVEASDRYVTSYFVHQLDPKFTYHNTSHTAYVVKSVNELCHLMQVKGYKRNILLVAAWFHDLGFTKQIEGHEQISAQVAEEFLSANRANKEDIALVKSCILATQYPQHPTTLLQEIICDADLMYLGEKDFIKTSAKLRREWELTRAITYSDRDWNSLNLSFISSHRFHTSYGLSKVERERSRIARLLKMSLATEMELN